MSSREREERGEPAADGATFAFSGLKLGVAYYPEYHLEERHIQDLDLMQAAGINVIRVGESVWSTWEPRDGEFNLEWLAPVLDAAHERGIRAILGTPTYAIPPWLQKAHPEIAAEDASGRPVPWGGRQEIDYTSPTFRSFAERVIRRVVGRYADHPAVIGFQVDNEPGLHLFHNDAVFRGFVARLERKYGDVDALNRAWGLTYWSHRLDQWEELWRPEGNTFPQYDLAWRRYQADLTTEFLAWQAEIVREYRRPDQFVTTCLAYGRPGADDRPVFAELDVAAGNVYYGMQDRLDPTLRNAPVDSWTTAGVAGLLRQADRVYSSQQQRFLVTETNAQAIAGPEVNYPPYPGQLEQAAFALVSRGAALVEYWHWHTLPYGAETYWGGVLPHSLVPGRIYREVAGLGLRFAALGGTLDGYDPHADAAILWSASSRYALQYMPPLNIDGAPVADSFEHIFDAFHRGLIESGRQARVMHVEQAVELGAAEMARRFPVLIAAGLYVLDDGSLDFLRAYAASGGHLVLGIRTGYGDDEARARVAVAPPRLHEAAGVRYEEFSNLDAEVPIRSADSTFTLSPSATGDLWADGLIADDADVLAEYRHPRFGDFAAVTTRKHGAGRVTVVGCVPSRSLVEDIVRWATPTPRSAALAEPVDLPLTVASGSLPDGRSAWFVFNWGWEPRSITLRVDAFDATTRERFPRGSMLGLEPWSTQVLLSENAQ